MESNMEVLKNLRVELPFDPAIPLLGIYLKECTQDMLDPLAHPCLLKHYLQ
jgi:hypothetical protein